MQAILTYFLAAQDSATDEHSYLSHVFRSDRLADRLSDDVLDQCVTHYEELIGRVSAQLGAPFFDGTSDEANFPEWIDAVMVTCWRQPDGIRYIALRITHENNGHATVMVYGRRGAIGPFTSPDIAERPMHSDH